MTTVNVLLGQEIRDARKDFVSKLETGVSSGELQGLTLVEKDGEDRIDLYLARGVDINDELIRQLMTRGLKYVVLPHAGVPGPVRDLLLQDEFKTLTLLTFHHNAQATAEMGIALLLASTRRIVSLDKKLRNGRWDRFPEGALCLYGKSALVLGYGRIGKQVAKVLTALGVKVYATRRTATAPCTTPDENGVFVYPPSSVNEILPKVAVLLLCLPETKETKNVIGEKELNLLTPPCCVVNIGRASAINEDAMWEWIQKEGTVYGSDVWWQEAANQKEGDAPLRMSTKPYNWEQRDDIVCTPHCAGGMGFASVEDARVTYFMQIITDILQGNDLQPVNLQLNY
eukprot:m.9648 g.9648  ORF g.9648 m.9648 type:complete len:342 (-) comp4105_c0_seq1:88-1113(-)